MVVIRFCAVLSLCLLGSLEVWGDAPKASPFAERIAARTLSFERNEGQAGDRFDFIARTNGATFLLESSGVTMDLGSDQTVTLKLLGGRTEAAAVEGKASGTRTSYFLGNDPAKWRTAVPGFERVWFDDVYDGIDVAYYGNQQHLEYDFIVAPHRDPRAIRLAFDGVACLGVDDTGDLLLDTGNREVRQLRPVAYQLRGEVREPVEAAYVIGADDVVTLRLGEYDRSRELVIDPTVVYSTLIPDVEVRVVTVASDGGAIVAGYLMTPVFFTQAALDPTFTPRGDIDYHRSELFLMKFTPDGSALQFATYLGGGQGETPTAIDLDSAGNIYLAGETSSSNFPVTPGAFMTGTYLGYDDGFVVKLSPAANQLLYGTYVPGGVPAAIAVDGDGQAVVSGGTAGGFPVTRERQPPDSSGFGSQDAFVLKLTADGSDAVYAIRIGGPGWENDALGPDGDVAVDAAGNAYVVGTTDGEFPVLNAFQEHCGGHGVFGCYGEGFVAKVDPAGNILWATYLGGSDYESSLHVAASADGYAFVTGFTGSDDFPLHNPFQSQLVDFGDAFITKFSPGGSVVFSTFFGGSAFGGVSSSEDPVDVELDASGNVVFGGNIRGYIPLKDPLEAPADGAYVSVLSGDGQQLLFSTHWPEVNLVDLATRGSDEIYALGKSADEYDTWVKDAWNSAGGDYQGSLTKFSRTSSIRTLELGRLYPRVGLTTGSTYINIRRGWGLPFTVDAKLSAGGNELDTWVSPDGEFLSATLPPHGAGPVTISVTDSGAGGTAILPNVFTYVVPMSITGVSPSTIRERVPTLVTFTGSGFGPGATIKFEEPGNGFHSGESYPVEYVNASTLRAWVTLYEGTYDVTIKNEDPGYEEFPDLTDTALAALTVSAPGLAYVTPDWGFTTGNQQVDLGCESCDTGTTLVEFDGTTATAESFFHGELTVRTPPHDPGPVDVTVTGPGGSSTFEDVFRYVLPLPTFSSLSPTSGSPEGGNTVTITGTGFREGAKVWAGAILAEDVVVVSDDTITFTAPPHSPGSVGIVVKNDGDLGSNQSFHDARYRYNGPVVSIHPIAGQAGSSVTVDVGQTPVPGLTVTFGGVPATITTIGYDDVTVTVPPNAAGENVDVVVTNPDGLSGTSWHRFLYLGPAPTISSINPPHGTRAGGTTVTITGTNFVAPAFVGLDSLEGRNVVVVNSSTITFKTPPLDGTATVNVQVTNGDGQVVRVDDAFSYDPGPSISFLTPTSGTSAGGTVVTINGSNFSPDAEVYFGDTLAAGVLWEGATQLLVGTPAHAVGTVNVTVENGDGQTYTRTNGFNFLPPVPTVTSFSPDHAATGNSITITGTGFQFVTSVRFFNNRAATFTVVDDTTITATVPSFAETGPVSITTESGTGVSPTNFTVDSTAPEITSFTPAIGAPGGTVTITGVRFTGATKVTFGGVSGAFTVNSDTQITATVPASVRNGKIVVQSPTGTGTSADSFLVPPRFGGTPFTPKLGVPGTGVTISGVNFDGTTEVLFNGVAATPFTVNAAGTSISTTVPATATTGAITVTASGGTATTTTSFAVTPQVDSFTPTLGAPGVSVVVTGLRFTGATAVTFGGVAAASFTVDSATQITAVTASGAKTGVVCVTTPGATGCSTAVFSLPPRFNSSPFSPAGAVPGTSIDINGVNFQGTTAVSFNGTTAPAFTANAAGTQIIVTVPEGATTGPVTVTAQGGTATSTKNFGVPPAVTSFTPANGTTGTSVTLTGVRFTGATAVKFGTISASSFTVVSDTQITAVVSSTAKSGTICVTTPGGSGCSSATFSVTARITGFSPGNALPGASVTINGSNFQGTTAVTFFNGQAASPFTVNAAGTSITTTVPANATTGPVMVTTPLGTVTSAASFGVQPAVSGFTPSQGDAGTTVTITGVRLTGATAVKFGGTGGGSSTSFTAVSDTQVNAVVPATGRSGTICVTTPGGTGCSAASFSMPPRVTGFNPDHAWPGAAVTVEGVNFHGATALTFHNGQPAPSFIINPAGTGITTTVPAGAITGPVTVTTPIGATTSTVHFGVHPAVTSFDPVSGEAGTNVTLTGERFTGATAVKFGGTSGGAATTFSVVNDTTITAVVPANGKSGTICVTTPGGTECSTGTFTMPPRITTFSPASALPGVNVTINGANFHDASAVSFNGVAQPTFAVNAGGTAITTTVPATATTGPVTVTTPAGNTTSATNFGVQAVVSGFTPASGDVATLVTITGERFTGATAVKFGGTGGVAATVFTVVDAQTITAEVPAAPKSGTVCVTTAASTACSSGTFSVPPRITGFNTGAALPGASVTINGFNFQGATAVAFNGTAQPVFTVNGAGTSVSTTVPAGATTGTVTVTTPFGTGTSAASFGVLPVVSGFTPASGAPGATVTITGERLADASGVEFGGTSGVAASFTVVNATTVTAVVPATAKSGTICVTTAAGTACSAGSFTVGARITSFSPTSGLPGASVSINGANFQGATAVAFNGVAQPAFTVNAAGTTITTTVPAAATTGPIAVTTPVGTATSATSFGVLPAVDGFTPSAGGPGTTVTVTGARFTGATVVKFNSTNATFTVTNDATISATVPAAATTGKISVTTPGGTGVSVASFTIGPKITSFSPTQGTPGTSVVINGSAFTGATAVAFDGVAATAFTVNTSTKITATVPAGATTGKISVTTPTGGSGFSTALFFLPPAITGFSPASGAPGAAVTVTGVNFEGAAAFAFNGTAAAFTVVSPTQISATVPDGATNGPLTVTTPYGPASSGSSFTVLAAPAPALTATATSGTSVSLVWSGGLTAQYDVQRSTSISGGFTTLTRVTGVLYNDSTVAANTAYLYRVVRVSDGVSSTVDHTTTVVFTDDSLPAKVIRHAHLTQLRTAVNALRACAGLAPAAWTDTPAAGLRVKALHVTELRNALTPALTALGASVTYTDATLTGGMRVKAAHHQEIRTAVR